MFLAHWLYHTFLVVRGYFTRCDIENSHTTKIKAKVSQNSRVKALLHTINHAYAPR